MPGKICLCGQDPAAETQGPSDESSALVKKLDGWQRG